MGKWTWERWEEKMGKPGTSEKEGGKEREDRGDAAVLQEPGQQRGCGTPLLPTLRGTTWSLVWP